MCFCAQVHADNIVQGLELGELDIFPAHEKDNAQPQAAATPDQRFYSAMNDELNAGPHAELLTKQFIRALTACQLVDSSMLMLDVGDAARPIIHLLCVFHDRAGVGPQEDLALHVWLPVRDEGD